MPNFQAEWRSFTNHESITSINTHKIKMQAKCLAKAGYTPSAPTYQVRGMRCTREAFIHWRNKQPKYLAGGL